MYNNRFQNESNFKVYTQHNFNSCFALMKIMFIIMKTAITLLFSIGFEKTEYQWIQDNNAYFLLLLSRNVLMTYL